MKKIIAILLLFFFNKTTAQNQFSVFFESNKFELSKTENSKLQEWLQSCKDAKIVGVYGFCDEDGSNGFNDTLAKKRIEFVFENIKNKIQIRSDFKSRSFGETQQFSKIKAENRRVTLYFLEAKDIVNEDRILGIKKPIEKPIEKPTAIAEIKYPQVLEFENPDGSVSKLDLDIAFMKRINQANAGEKLRVENLNFQINTFAILPESRAKLYELLIVLQTNPKLKIQIQGHLCCMPIDRVDLSTQRARAIYNFLIANNIPKERLAFKGFGSTMPLFALPEKSEQERAANRRVEILVLENK